MNEFVLNVIWILHILIIIFIIGAPFTNSNYILFVHFIFVPFMILHWVLNDNTCVLTIIEKRIRKQLYGKEVDGNECYTGKLIEPIYDFKKNYQTLSVLIYVVVIGLWLITTYKLYNKYQNGELSNCKDLFTF
ncbi:MAG: hypothetical protein Edafosvirus14_11 [Edafosvirus sp.]|uniref:DUF2784 domain-containing protein n=1 Tax=Edafosvirus sp. TaxID=2487765 RepID=A0A3G4ZVU1_9VIRU|nr:MAG: hypothetical protein Edafosvirus14_11 [Edafosvirus sp.]